MHDFALYVGVGSLEKPSTGLDNVIRTHLDELSKGDVLIRAIVVSPTIEKYEFHEQGMCRIHIYPNVMRSAKWPLLNKLALLLLSCCPMQAFSLYSPRAKRHIRQIAGQQRKPLLIVDHLYATVNLPWSLLFESKRRLISISHDVTHVMLTEILEAKTGLKKLSSKLQIAKARFIESRMVKRSRPAIFLSEYDRNRYLTSNTDSISLLPFPKEAYDPSPFSDLPRGKHLVFVGSPGFAPNGYAIQWLVEKLAPELARIAPDLRIVLVGRNTETCVPIGKPNVLAAGFVSDEALQETLRTAMALICPVVHGGGVKIKILDALRENCPVLATEQALRGYESFAIAPKVWIESPTRTAEAILAFSQDMAERSQASKQLFERLTSYRAQRQGKLAAIVNDAMRSFE